MFHIPNNRFEIDKSAREVWRAGWRVTSDSCGPDDWSKEVKNTLTGQHRDWGDGVNRDTWEIKPFIFGITDAEFGQFSEETQDWMGEVVEKVEDWSDAERSKDFGKFPSMS